MLTISISVCVYMYTYMLFVIAQSLLGGGATIASFLIQRIVLFLPFPKLFFTLRYPPTALPSHNLLTQHPRLNTYNVAILPYCVTCNIQEIYISFLLALLHFTRFR